MERTSEAFHWYLWEENTDNKYDEYDDDDDDDDKQKEKTKNKKKKKKKQ